MTAKASRLFEGGQSDFSRRRRHRALPNGASVAVPGARLPMASEHEAAQ